MAILACGEIAPAKDRQPSVAQVLKALEARDLQLKGQLSPAQVRRVVQRAAKLEQRGKLDDAVSILQRSLLLTDDPQPRYALAAAHTLRARLYQTFAETAKNNAKAKHAKRYQAHARTEAEKAERLLAQARQLAFDRADVDENGRVSHVEGLVLLKVLGGSSRPQVKLAGLTGQGVAILNAAAAATKATQEPLVVLETRPVRGRIDAIDLQLPPGAERRAALKRALEAQLRLRGLSDLTVKVTTTHLHIGPARTVSLSQSSG